MTRRAGDQLLLGEWACLGIVCAAPAHGFAIAGRLKPSGDVGRVWSLSRPLTYRCLDQLLARGYIGVSGEEPGVAGGSRTILAATTSGRTQLRRWLDEPVIHLRDLRSALLLKLVLADICDVDVSAMLHHQRSHIAQLAGAIDEQVAAAATPDPVLRWRHEASHAALRFVDGVLSDAAPSGRRPARSSPRR